MSPKTTKTPLSTASGNSKTRGSGKKSQKAEENEAQKEEGLIILEDSPDTAITIIPETQLEPQPSNEASVRIEDKIGALTAMTALFRAEINELKSIHQIEVADLKKIVEQLQIELHELREQGATTGPVRPPLSSYTAAVGSAQGPLISTGLPTRIIPARAEELFCTVDFSRVEHYEEITAADPAALRKKIEQEIQKQDEKIEFL